MKFRIKPAIIESELKYIIEKRRLFRWVVHYKCIDLGYGSTCELPSFSTVALAHQYIRTTFGSEAQIMDTFL